MKIINKYIKPYILIYFFTVGVILHAVPITRDLSIVLTPLFLLLCYIWILGNLYKEGQKGSISIAIIISILAFTVEAIGVKTGVIFGEYSYGEILGLRIFTTPVIIGALWYMLVGGAMETFSMIKGRIPRILTSAIMVTVVDVFIEPVAIHLGYWKWLSGDIPLQNYIAWFLIALCLSSIYSRTSLPNSSNARFQLRQIYILILAFFVILNILIRLGIL